MDKVDSHAAKVSGHANDRQAHQTAKTARMDRHPGTGHGIKADPKKGGGGHGNWGSYKDDIEDAKAQL